MRFALRSAAALLGFALPASAQTVLFSDGFENGLSNWNATGFWHVESITDTCVSQVQPLPEGTHCAYYGIAGQCHYHTGTLPNSGALTLLVPIVLPAGGPSATLHCWTRQVTETCVPLGPYDAFDLEVSSNGGANWILVGKRCSNAGLGAPEDVWSARGIDLTSFLGQSILLRVRFDTFDEFLNFGMGALIDKIEVRLEAGQPFCTSDCPCGTPFNNSELGYGNLSGCTSSQAREGELAGGGTPSVASDNVSLSATRLVTPGLALFLQTSSHGPGAFSGDGRFCLTGSSTRLAARTVVNGSVTLPGPGDPPLSVMGSVPAVGGTRHYQVVYRDPASWCTTATVNHTNGYAITWTP